jgi:hypothetical protein
MFVGILIYRISKTIAAPKSEPAARNDWSFETLQPYLNPKCFEPSAATERLERLEPADAC